MQIREITQLSDAEQLILEAMKEKDNTLLSVLRLIKSKIVFAEKANGKPLDKQGCISTLIKMKKEHDDSIKAYKDAGRDDLAENEQKELEIISLFLPKDVPSDEDILAFVDAEIAAIRAENGSIAMKDMGRIMGKVKKQFPLADGGLVSAHVKKHIG